MPATPNFSNYTFTDGAVETSINTDITNTQNYQAAAKSAQVAEAATPNYVGPLQTAVVHDQDQVTVNLDDLTKQEQQKQIDLVTTVYGTTGPDSNLVQAQADLAADAEQETIDQQEP